MGNSREQDEKADNAIRIMVGATAAAAAVPAHVNWAIMASALGVGVVSIGKCYGTALNKDEAWKLVVQFIKGAGIAWAGFAIGYKVLAAIIESTGLGYFGAAAVDVAVSSAIAWAVGACAKAYFKGERDKKALGSIFRNTFEKNKK